MTTSHSTLVLFRPEGNDPIQDATLVYLRTRNRLKAFSLIQSAFDRAGITQAALAARLKKDPGQLSRLLNAPGNWTLDTVSDLLFAICGGVPAYGMNFPLDKPEKSTSPPAWVPDRLVKAGGASRLILVDNPLSSDKPTATQSQVYAAAA